MGAMRARRLLRRIEKRILHCRAARKCLFARIRSSGSPVRRSTISPSRMKPRSEYSICCAGLADERLGHHAARGRLRGLLAWRKKSRCAGRPESCSRSIRTVTRARQEGSGSDLAAAAHSGKIAGDGRVEVEIALLDEPHDGGGGDDGLGERGDIVNGVRRDGGRFASRVRLPKGWSASCSSSRRRGRRRGRRRRRRRDRAGRRRLQARGHSRRRGASVMGLAANVHAVAALDGAGNGDGNLSADIDLAETGRGRRRAAKRRSWRIRRARWARWESARSDRGCRRRRPRWVFPARAIDSRRRADRRESRRCLCGRRRATKRAAMATS